MNILHNLMQLSAKIPDRENRIDAWVVAVCLSAIEVAIGIAVIIAIN